MEKQVTINIRTKNIERSLWGIDNGISILFLLGLYHFEYMTGFWIFLTLFIINNLMLVVKMARNTQ